MLVTRVRSRALNKPAPQLHTITNTNCVTNTSLYVRCVSMTKGYSIFIMRGSSAVRSVTSASARRIPMTYANAAIVWRIISPLQMRLETFVLRAVSCNATLLLEQSLQSSDIVVKISINCLRTILPIMPTTTATKSWHVFARYRWNVKHYNFLLIFGVVISYDCRRFFILGSSHILITTIWNLSYVKYSAFHSELSTSSFYLNYAVCDIFISVIMIQPPPSLNLSLRSI